jgi:sugar lactone lactonase YvrE
MRGIIFFLAAAVATPDNAPKQTFESYQAAAQAANSALTNADYESAEVSLRKAIGLGPQNPGVVYRLASVEARRGETADALAMLKRYAEMGIARDGDPDSDFGKLVSNAAYKRIKARVADNTRAICPCDTVFTGGVQPFIAEGIARDPTSDRMFIAGVHARKIISMTDGRIADFAQMPEDYSPFGITIDVRRRLLWASAAVVAQGAGSGSGVAAKSALIAFDLKSGALVKIYAAPDDPKPSIGDITLAPDGTVYVSDSQEGSLFKLAPAGEVLTPVGSSAMLASAQGLAVSDDGEALLVADYSMGLVRIDLTTGEATAVAAPANVTTLGIDGLARLADGSFIATQNGFAHARIVRFRLTPDWTRLLSLTVVAANTPEIADPSLITTDGKDAYVVGVSQWASFDDGKKDAARPLLPWTIVRLNLGKNSRA